MQLSQMPKIMKKSSRRVGRGQGSGRGKTSGKGTKGQNARGKLSITHQHYEGGQRPLIKRLPYRRGKGNRKVTNSPIIVNIKALSTLPENVSIIDIEVLVKNKIVKENDAKTFGVKILGDGKITRPFVINLPISKSAAVMVEKAGGKIGK